LLSIGPRAWQGVEVTTTPSRRLGAADSKSRTQLLDAAEQLLVDEGYAAVTSRRVAARAGLKPQLVHYYFRTMDDLFVEVFRRRADATIERVERAAADGSLRALWRLNSDPRGAAFIVEFVALANHRKAIRAELAHYAERNRAIQLAALAATLEAHGLADRIPPVVAHLLMTGLTQVMGLERAFGFTAGHDAAVAYVDGILARLEPDG
jgi:AcrR family transcriptional regulator